MIITINSKYNFHFVDVFDRIDLFVNDAYMSTRSILIEGSFKMMMFLSKAFNYKDKKVNKTHLSTFK